jgi:CheY-like chemotaxis protein
MLMSIDRRILIADDDRELRAGMAELLAGFGARILQVETGIEALELLRRRAIDLALLDMHMPGHTGLELLTVVRRETLAIPCIFWSGDMTDALHEMALREGALAVLRKPIDPALLRLEVRRALDRDGALGG